MAQGGLQIRYTGGGVWQMKKPSKEKLIMWVLVFLALAGLTVRFLHREYSLASVLSSIKEADPIWLLPGVGAMALFFVCEGANIGRSLRLAGHNISRIDEIRGILHIRRHLAATPLFKGIPNFREKRIAMLQAKTFAELDEILTDIETNILPTI